MSDTQFSDTLGQVITQLPPELHEMARAIHKDLPIQSFSMSASPMLGDDGAEITGLEVIPMSGTHNGVAIFSMGDDWHIALLEEDGSSKNGWAQAKNNCTIAEVVVAIWSILSGSN